MKLFLNFQTKAMCKSKPQNKPKLFDEKSLSTLLELVKKMLKEIEKTCESIGPPLRRPIFYIKTAVTNRFVTGA